jgi:hypothetical protein
MAQALHFLHPPSPRPRGGSLLALLVLSASLLAARHYAHQAALERSLHRPRPPLQAVVRGLASEHGATVEVALAALDRLPPSQGARALGACPFGRGLPVDQLAPPLLRRRGDKAALAALASLPRQ